MTDTSGPGFTPEQAAQATDPQRNEAPPVGASIPPPLLGARIGAAGPDQVDVSALEDRLNAQIAALAAEVSRLKQGQAARGTHPLAGTAKAIRDMLATHFDHNLGADGGPVMRLADDVVDAAGNAVTSGDTSTVRELAGRLERAMNRVHPGPGDHHWFRQALDFTRNHLLEAADTITEPADGPAGPAIGTSAAPARVIPGSVTGEVRQPLPAGGGEGTARGVFVRS